MAKKLIIFDCDGVLVDSEYISSKIFAEALATYGYPISIEDSIRRFTGVNAHAARQTIMQESTADIPEDYWIRQQQNLFDAFTNDLMPLIQPVLDKLKELKVHCCVASNSPRTYIHHCLGLTNQTTYFGDATIYTAEQVSHAKPAPDLFLFAAQEMGFAPENCLVIEDSPAGIKAALAAGMPVLGYLGGSHARYDWYDEKINPFGIPVAKNCQELLHAIAQFLRPAKG